MIKFEDIHKEVFKRLSGMPGVKMLSRKWVKWSDNNPPSMPAVYLNSRSATPRYTQHLPPVWTLVIDIVGYVNNGNAPNQILSSPVHEMMDSIRYALRPDEITGVVDLGFDGVVFYCRLGAFEIQEGLEGNISSCTGSLEIEFSECY